jgi:outer membrane murein-binding lipoprotein Lpp
MTAIRRCLCPAVLLAGALLAGCASLVDVSVKGGSASDTEWRVGIPF